MTPVAGHVHVHDQYWLIETTRGLAVLAETSNPLALQPPSFTTYVLLCSWRRHSEPAGMFVTVNPYEADGRAQREVNLLYADPALRGRSGGESIPVLMGKHLVSHGLVTIHSADRNEAGDRWAIAVGGKVPDRVDLAVPGSSERHGRAALDRLNQIAWPAQLTAALGW